MRSLVLAIFFSSSLVCAQASVEAPDHHLVEVAIKDTRHLMRLLRLDLDLASCRVPEVGVKQVQVIATDAELAKLKKNGFSPQVVIRNLEDHYEAGMRKHSLGRPETLTPPLGQGAMGGHYTLAQMEAHLDAFAKNYPKICAKKVSIGKSVENRDLWMVKISDNVAVNENEPEVFYDALHHAREPLSMEATLLFMDELLDGYGKDPEATFLINEREMFFVTCVNPDGYEYNRSIRPNGGGLWRKNRKHSGNNRYGIDLNRNYATGWSAPNGGSSTDPSSSTYRGTKAFSEPETAAVEAFARSRKFVNANSCHTYGELLLEPWGYQRGSPPNKDEYDKLGKQLLAKHSMTRGAASGVLYIASGTALDHHHAAHGSYSWSPELGSSGEGGFWPSGSNIEKIARRHQPMFRAIARTAGAALSINSITVTEVGGNRNGTVEPGESGAIVVKVDNNGASATVTAGTVRLKAVSSGIPIGTSTASLGIVPKFGSSSNSGTPLTFSVPLSYGALVIKLKLSVLGDGLVTTRDISIVLAPLRPAVDDDMEKDRGFERAPVGTATTGHWGRGAPQQTSSGGVIYQPGNDHSPVGTMCWVTDARAGASAGTYDVDTGYTDLLSPVFELSHLALAHVEFFRWYAESRNDDPFRVYISSNGGSSWTEVFSSSASTGNWVSFSHEIQGPLTDQMRFRFRAQDLAASLVEAAIDDFSIKGVTKDGNLTLMTSGARGTTVQFGFNGASGGSSRLLLGFAKVSPISIPGIDGTLVLDPATVRILTSFAIGSSGFLGFDLLIPNDPTLAGKTFYWQALYQKGGATRFSNLQSLKVK
jgi:hypothetical protein